MMSESVQLWLFGGAYSLIGILFALYLRFATQMGSLKITITRVDLTVQHIKELIDLRDRMIDTNIRALRTEVKHANELIMDVGRDIGALKAGMESLK